MNQIKKDKQKLEVLKKEFETIVNDEFRGYNREELIEMIKTHRQEITELRHRLDHLRKEKLTVPEYFQDALDLLEAKAVQKKLTSIASKLSNAEKWVRKVLLIIIDTQRITIDEVSNYIDEISRNSIASIIGRLSTKNFLKKEYEGYTVYYSLNKKYLQEIINRDLKRKKLDETLGGGR